MAQSKREQILQIAHAALLTLGVPVFRSPYAAISAKKNARAIVLDWGSDSVRPIENQEAVRNLAMTVSAMARGSDAEASADELLVNAHAAIMGADYSSVAIYVVPAGGRNNHADADYQECTVSEAYNVSYRHFYSTLDN